MLFIQTINDNYKTEVILLYLTVETHGKKACTNAYSSDSQIRRCRPFVDIFNFEGDIERVLKRLKFVKSVLNKKKSYNYKYFIAVCKAFFRDDAI